MKRIQQLLFFILFLIYEETIFTILTVQTTENILLKLIFIILSSIILDTIVKLFSEKKRVIITNVLLVIIPCFYIIYTIYYKIFGNTLSLYSIINGTQALTFGEIIFEKIFSVWYGIIGFILPIVVYNLFFRKRLDYSKQAREIVINLVAIILVYVLSIGCIHFTSNSNDINSNLNLYYNINNSNYNLRRFGLFTTIRLDVQRTVFGFKEKSLYIYKSEDGEEKVISSEEYNVIDINFEELIQNETNEDIKEIHEYISRQEPSKKNKYTGLFEGKNLIVFVAESFSELAIREDVTPTLYKMYNQGFQFKNFYTPLFPVSTADGEYLTDISLVPAENTWSIEKIPGNYVPYSYANILKKDGYKSFAYHNYEYDYYNRQDYFATMGYDIYLAQGNGLEERMSFEDYPASDYEMVKVTVDDYINEDNFIAYYMTMSGHINYKPEHAMVVKNWDRVKDLPYSDKAKYYLATQVELDLAMEELINRLEEAGKLDDTVIVITADHYPYGLTLEEMNELSTFNMDRTFDKFKMPFVLYNSEFKKDIVIEKYGASMDVLPTMLNLFGVEFDSRLLMGRDILSDCEPLIIFSDRSFIEADGRYDSNIRKYISDKEVTQEHIKKVQQDIYHKYRYSRLILENDYYNSLKQARSIVNTKRS